MLFKQLVDVGQKFVVRSHMYNFNGSHNKGGLKIWQKADEVGEGRILAW